MAEEKKRDDNIIDMGAGDRNAKSFEPASSTRPPHANAPSLTSNPIFPVLSYCASSILMTVTNKYVLSGFGFNLSFFLLCVQSVVCVVAIQVCKSLRVITYRDFDSDEAKKWFPISLLLIGMTYTSTKALQYLSIPVYTIFKNLTIILIAYGEVLWFGGSVTGMALFSFGLMVLSSIIAAWADIQHALQNHGHSGHETSARISTLNSGYVWMMLNCLCTSTYVLGMRKRIKLTNFKDFDTMFYNNLLSIPILVACSVLIEDWTPKNVAQNFPPAQRNNLITAMIISGLSTVFISYTSAWCVRVTSSTTYSMVGALNKLPIALSGLIFFDAPVTFPSVSAIAVGFVSGIVYALAKVRQSAKSRHILPTSNPPMSASSQRSGRTREDVAGAKAAARGTVAPQFKKRIQQENQARHVYYKPTQDDYWARELELAAEQALEAKDAPTQQEGPQPENQNLSIINGNSVKQGFRKVGDSFKQAATEKLEFLGHAINAMSGISGGGAKPVTPMFEAPAANLVPQVMAPW
ncbi:MAG: GDP-mannose transporter into the lumen of the Golgi [Peltula sp. TS41687]|nr:MAG: GDP-mannose transporter into the lumen of the Golgi [Peltula sp. TS41687]